MSKPLAFVAVVAALGALGCQKPVIESFTAVPPAVEAGRRVTLQYAVRDADEVTISGVGAVDPAGGSTTVPIEETTSFVLTATNGAGTTSSAPLTVAVTARLDAAGGVYRRGTVVGATFAFVLTDAAGAPPATPTSIQVNRPGAASDHDVTCPAGEALCLVVLPETAAVSGEHTATATLGGASLTETFTVDAAGRIFAPEPVLAEQTSSTTVDAVWTEVPQAASYRARLIDASGAPLGPDVVVKGTSATLTASAALGSGFEVEVEASALDLTEAAALPDPLPAPHLGVARAAPGGDPTAWQLFTPDDFVGNTLTAQFPTLGASERLAVIVLNIGGADYAPGAPADNVTVDVSGTLSFTARPAPERHLETPWSDDGAWAAHAELQRLERERVGAALQDGVFTPSPSAQAAPAPVPSTSSFCIRHGLTTTFSRRNATLRRETARAAFFVDDADLDDFASHEPGIWDSLEADWEGTSGIYQTVTSAFGPESDVDDNQKLIIVFSSLLGAPSASGVILGYFSSGDLLFARDTSAGCSGSASNAGDIFYMNAIQNLVPGTGTAAEVIGHTYPATLAHEFQHLINTNAHCLETTCTALEETWLNEGLSMVAEDVAGYGWHADTFKASLYLDRLAGPNYYGYNRRSLTVWEGDPIGNYEGAHTFVRYWADRMGGDILRRLVAGSARGVDRLEAVLAIPFEQQLAHWTTALMFSNEPFSPSLTFSYTDPAWTPFHLDVGYVNYRKLNPGGLSGQVRRDGWNAFVTGVGSGGTATVTVTSTEVVKPHVVMVRFAGTMPQCNVGTPDLTGACNDIE